MSLPATQQVRLLDGAEKVAAVLLALDRETSSRILKHFDMRELREIARTAARLGAVPAAILEDLCHVLIDEIADGDIDLVGNAAQAEELLSGVLPDESVADIMCALRGASNQFFWRRVAALPERTLADYLEKQHPQVIAVVVAKLDPASAARTLAQLSGSARARAMRRMLISKPLADAVLRALEDALQDDLFSAVGAPSSSEVSVRVAGIMNQLEREQIDETLAGIGESEPALAAQLKALLFSFEDIVKLGQRARMIVFDQAPTDRVILALRGSDGAIRDVVLPCLSARTRRMVEAELAAPAEPPRREILAAQREIASLVLRLADQGLIELSGEESSPRA
jgi:flagellar motor switch protein FliG